jgi:hypothetical protein
VVLARIASTLANCRASEGHSRGITGHWYGMTCSEKRKGRDPLERATMARGEGTDKRVETRAYLRVYARGGMRVGIRDMKALEQFASRIV